MAIRVLYSFPHKIGAHRICRTAWHQVAGVAAAGAEVLVFPGVVHRPLPPDVRAVPTLARGRFRVPYRAIGHMHAFDYHDRIVARRLLKLGDRIDVVHTWPLGALQTLRVARELGIPTVLERPNTHTRFGYRVVREESERLGITLPPDHEYASKAHVLEKEEVEYRLADRLLCPSAFVEQTFLDEGYPPEQLARHRYGFDETEFVPQARTPGPGLDMLFVGVCAVLKGLHFALEAWLRSPAHRTGTFRIAGEFLPSYRAHLEPLLQHPSVQVLGYRNDIPELMQTSDIFVLPSITEGFPLSVAEARGSGCVPLVSEAAAAACTHDEDSLVHAVGDVDALTRHITSLHEDRALLQRLRTTSLRTIDQMTWAAAGERLLEVYEDVVAESRSERRVTVVGR